MSDIIRRRALLGTRNGEAHECMVEYEFPRSDLSSISDTQIKKYTFGPSNITNVNWPSGIKHIFKYSFCNSRITASTINSMPSTVEQIDSYAFYSCPNVTGSITFPSSIRFIGDYCFASSAGITSITFPETDSLCLCSYCFYSCTNLATINISNNTALAISGNYALTSTAWYSSQSNGNVYLGKNYYQYKGTMPSNTNLTLEAGTLSIGYGAFQSKTQLKSITIPDTVKFIGGYAFSGCTGLTSITIPKSLSRTLYTEFNRTQYNELSATGGGGSSTAWNSPFYSSACTGITTVNWNAIDGYGGSTTSANYCFLGGGTYLPNVTTVNFGSEVEIIPQYICYNLKKITSITIPSSAVHISYYAFGNCTGLTSITIPETVERLSSSGYILTGCTGITTLNYNAISCVRATDSTFSTTNTSTNCWGTLANLTTVNIGNQVQIIPCGFLGSAQSQVTSITIPSSVTTLKQYSFYQSKLTSIDLPSSITSIGNNSFYGCSSLTSITIRSTTPPTLESSYTNTFPTTTQSYTIYVPASAVNTYKTTSKWSNWASKIQAIPS